MIRPSDRREALTVAAIVLAARVVREGPDVLLMREVYASCAGAAANLLTAVMRHEPPKARRAK